MNGLRMDAMTADDLRIDGAERPFYIQRESEKFCDITETERYVCKDGVGKVEEEKREETSGLEERA